MRLVGLAAVALAAMASTGVAAQSPSVVVNPDWQRRPTLKEVEDEYPAMAAAFGIHGYAVLSCTVLSSGRLSGCEAEAASPPGLGFDKAALALSAQFRMTPKTLDGVPTDDGAVRIPIRFKLPDEKAVGATSALAPKPSSKQALDLARELTRLSVSTQRLDADLAEAYKDFDAKGSVGVAPEAHEAGKAIIERTRADLRAKYLEGHAMFLAANLSTQELQSLIALHSRPGVVALRDKDAVLSGRLAGTFTSFWQTVSSGAHARICAARDCVRSLDAPPPVLEWADMPDWGARYRAAPAAAGILRVAGHADLECGAGANGMLQRCRIVAESPRGFDFGEAALLLAPSYRLKTPLGPGEKAALRVRFPASAATPPPARTSPSLSPSQREALIERSAMFLSAFRRSRYDTLIDSPNLGTNQALLREAFEAQEAAAIANLDRLVDDQSAVYAEVFSAEELADIFALWGSPADMKRERLWVEQSGAWDDYGKAVRDEVWAAARREFCKGRDCRTGPPPQ